ncbi:hypothetical protein JBE04_34310 [Streptomyces sp. PRKS01-29]|nr:DUF6177 family protein [Streptomyces sabulosicollis]MBI0299399.1 hypothetical protein [Streptomyces sabulosicollis]
MTKDVIALTERMPDIWSIVAGLFAGGPDLDVRAAGEGAVVQMCDEAGRPLVSVEAPLLVRVAGEAARLLGPEAGGTGVPVWWTEARAATGVERAELLAASFARRLARLCGGSVWPSAAAADAGAAQPGAASAAPAAAQPAVDVLTERTAVVLQDRPVVAMTAWLSDAIRAAAASDRAVQIVTPATSRLSLPTRLALTGPPSRWVVRDEEGGGYYDGLSGALLRWHDGGFAPVEAEPERTPVARAFLKGAEDTGERQLTLSFRTVHPADEGLVLGRPLEAAWTAVTGGPPAGWSTAEPVNLPWSCEALTALARDRAPESTWAVAVGRADRPAIATLRVERTARGVEQDVTLAFGHGPGEKPPLDVLPDLAATLVTEHRLQSMLVQMRAARRDLSLPARFEPPAVPVGFALGADEVREVGLTFARRTPLPARPVPLGPAARPGFYYPLGDGGSPSSWALFEQLMRHLRQSD